MLKRVNQIKMKDEKQLKKKQKISQHEIWEND